LHQDKVKKKAIFDRRFFFFTTLVFFLKKRNNHELKTERKLCRAVHRLRDLFFKKNMWKCVIFFISFIHLSRKKRKGKKQVTEARDSDPVVSKKKTKNFIQNMVDDNVSDRNRGVYHNTRERNEDADLELSLKTKDELVAGLNFAKMVMRYCSVLEETSTGPLDVRNDARLLQSRAIELIHDMEVMSDRTP
jgi:hypothetical protein